LWQNQNLGIKSGSNPNFELSKPSFMLRRECHKSGLDLPRNLNSQFKFLVSTNFSVVFWDNNLIHRPWKFRLSNCLCDCL